MTSITTSAPEIVATEPRARQRGLTSLYMQLTKARLSALVLLTAGVGFILGSPVGQSAAGLDWWRLAWTMLGTALAAGSASALNQFIEINRDALMLRTRHRPLPSGNMSLTHCLIAAIAMGVTGVALLAALVNVTAAVLALTTIVLYVLAYTPLKVRSTLNTLVGAVCGAIPPMIGWVAAAGTLNRGAWVLAAILFVWQIPHFMALAWLYREDYQRGGYAMLPVVDRDGRLTCRVVVLTAALLLPVGLLAALLGVAGAVYAAISLLLGAWMVALSLRLYFNRTHANARGVFLASITYLPLLMCLMVIDRGPMW